MTERTPENPQYLYETAEIEIALIGSPPNERRLLRLRIAIRPVPPPAGSLGKALAFGPWMVLPLEHADHLVAALQESLRRARSISSTPSASQ